ncbi:hypothetical protein GDO81_018520 [Engystomops pustulosus]|uniref:Uncharacterized protein n=1 Tax=Engystomops pustulosus TaxID=76066 RepID=A0AAV6YJ98_ENGPU|nr:hypothetical protein GDO81_018520 [Engystomops pustulosus]
MGEMPESEKLTLCTCGISLTKSLNWTNNFPINFTLFKQIILYKIHRHKIQNCHNSNKHSEYTIPLQNHYIFGFPQQFKSCRDTD